MPCHSTISAHVQSGNNKKTHTPHSIIDAFENGSCVHNAHFEKYFAIWPIRFDFLSLSMQLCTHSRTEHFVMFLFNSCHNLPEIWMNVFATTPMKRLAVNHWLGSCPVFGHRYTRCRCSRSMVLVAFCTVDFRFSMKILMIIWSMLPLNKMIEFRTMNGRCTQVLSNRHQLKCNQFYRIFSSRQFYLCVQFGF